MRDEERRSWQGGAGASVASARCTSGGSTRGWRRLTCQAGVLTRRRWQREGGGGVRSKRGPGLDWLMVLAAGRVRRAARLEASSVAEAVCGRAVEAVDAGAADGEMTWWFSRGWDAHGQT